MDFVTKSQTGDPRSRGLCTIPADQGHIDLRGRGEISNLNEDLHETHSKCNVMLI